MPLVKLFGHLRDYAGGSEFEVAGQTVGEALTRLCADNEPLHNAIFDQEGVLSHVRALLDGRDVELAQGLNTALDDSDQLAIFPPIAGG